LEKSNEHPDRGIALAELAESEQQAEEAEEEVENEDGEEEEDEGADATDGQLSLKPRCKGKSARHGCAPVEATPGPPICCDAMTASCLACSRGQTVEEYCKDNADTAGCDMPAPVEATPGPRYCCKAMTASCLACSRGQTVAVYCRDHPDTAGCDRKEGRGKGSGRGRKAKAAKETWGRRR